MTRAVFKSYPLENDLEMAALILVGLPAVVLRGVGAFLGLRPAKVGSIVNINEKMLERPLRELGGRAPLQMAATEPGAREVERVLGRIEHGIFA